MQYKVSYLIDDEESPTIVRTRSTRPHPSEVVQIDSSVYVVEEVVELSTQPADRVYLLVKVARKTHSACH